MARELINCWAWLSQDAEKQECRKAKIFERRKKTMLETIIVILLVLWLIGLVGGQTLGGFLHLLLVIALVIFVIRLLTGRRAV